MEKMKMHSANFAEENIEKLATLFPNCVTETEDDSGNLKKTIDFDLLKQELSTNIVEGPQERYRLDWPGKREALLTANAPIAKTLRPCREESVDFDSTENLFIEGDNLDALKLLQETYLGKVKMIYIDPPYNTGKDFIYSDKFANSTDEYMLDSEQKDDEGNRLVTNLESNGRFHSDWLSMMYSRLKLARNLLSDDGFILISIDDAEIDNLLIAVKEIFGGNNFVANIIWDKNRKNDAKLFSVGHDYMIVVAKNKGLLTEKNIILREPKPGIDKAQSFFNSLKEKFKDDFESIQSEWRLFFNKLPKDHPHKKLGRFSKIDSKGPYRDDGNISWPGGGGPRYEVLHPATQKPCKIPDGGWRYSAVKRFQEEVVNGRVVFGPDETTLPRQCRHLFESTGQVMTSVHFSYAQTATMKFSDLMGAGIFDNPKNWDDIKRLIRYTTSPNDIILDFFAGSATTAHAVMQLNSEDKSERKFIMVQIPEACGEKTNAFKAGHNTIAEISKERIRRAGQKILKEKGLTASDLDVGFRVLKIDSSNMADIYYRPDEFTQDMVAQMQGNIKTDRSTEDLLFQVLLDWGVDLTLPIKKETIEGNEVFFVDGNALAACFATKGEVTEDFCKELAGREPLRVVFRDAGFKDDSVKINIEQIFKLMSPHTDVKTI